MPETRFQKGDRVRLIKAFDGRDVGTEGTIQTPAGEKGFLYNRVRYDTDTAGLGYTSLLCDHELESVEEGEFEPELPPNHILPVGEMYVVSRHTVPTQVEYFGTDKDDRALFREAKK